MNEEHSKSIYNNNNKKSLTMDKYKTPEMLEISMK